LSANFFDARDERDYEKEERERKKLDEVRRKHGKKVRKALMAREGNHTYETDSDDNPYGESVSDEFQFEFDPTLVVFTNSYILSPTG
jgi:transcription initiation factor TFIIF subunit alpha